MSIAVEVKITGEDDRIVIVENAENDMHARLAAYYYIYNLIAPQTQPSIEKLLEVTSLWKSSGPVSATIYKNPFK